MRLVGLAVAGLLAGAAPASAQYYIPRPMAPIGPASPQDAAEIVQAMGLEPIGPAMQNGPFYVQRATDDYGRVLRVTVDARRSQVMSVEPVGAPRPPYGAYAGYGPYRPYPGYAALGPRYDNLAAPGSIMAPQAQPPHQAAITPNPQFAPPAAAPVKPKAKSAAITPQHPAAPPTPRKRPSAAPQEAAGSVEPVASPSAPKATTAPSAAPASAAPPAAEKPQGGSMPPVAPLE